MKTYNLIFGLNISCVRGFSGNKKNDIIDQRLSFLWKQKQWNFFLESKMKECELYNSIIIFFENEFEENKFEEKFGKILKKSTSSKMIFIKVPKRDFVIKFLDLKCPSKYKNTFEEIRKKYFKIYGEYPNKCNYVIMDEFCFVDILKDRNEILPHYLMKGVGPIEFSTKCDTENPSDEDFDMTKLVKVENIVK